MVIRDYRPDDFQQVIGLWKETGIFRPERGDTPEVIRRTGKLGGKFLVIWDPVSGNLHGTSWLTFDGRRTYIHHFAISPSMQGKGLGRALARESLKSAAQNGCPVKLEVHRENHRAIRLYGSLGFKKLEGYDVYMLLEP